MTGFPVRQEQDAVASRKVVATAIVAAIVGGVALFFAGFILSKQATTVRPGTWERQAVAVPRADERDRLNRYEWIDRDAGIAAIPIDRAIDLVVEKESRR